MKLKNTPVIEPLDVKSETSSDMSEYGNEVDDIELEMYSNMTEQEIQPHIVIREVKETRFSFVEYYDSSYTPADYDKPSSRLTRQLAIDSTHLLSPPPFLRNQSSQESDSASRSPHPLTPTIFLTPQSSLETGSIRSSLVPRSPNLLSPPPARRPSSPIPRRRASNASIEVQETHRLSRETSSRIGSNVRSKRQYSVPVQEKLKKSKSKDEEKGINPLPVMGAVIIASLLGGPVCLVANLKLGMFAAIGGGIMGYTTGKMFSDHGEREALIKGEYADVCGKDSKDARRKKMLKRIHEYEKFLENCNRLKKIEKEKQETLKKMRRHTMIEGMFLKPMFSVLIRSKSLSYLEIIQPSEEERKMERFSLPPLPDYDSTLNLEDKILLWQSCGGPFPKTGWTRATSLADLAEEAVDEEHTRRRVKKFKEVALLLWIITSLFQKARRNSTECKI